MRTYSIVHTSNPYHMRIPLRCIVRCCFDAINCGSSCALQDQWRPPYKIERKEMDPASDSCPLTKNNRFWCETMGIMGPIRSNSKSNEPPLYQRQRWGPALDSRACTGLLGGTRTHSQACGVWGCLPGRRSEISFRGKDKNLHCLSRRSPIAVKETKLFLGVASPSKLRMLGLLQVP